MGSISTNVRKSGKEKPRGNPGRYFLKKGLVVLVEKKVSFSGSDTWLHGGGAFGLRGRLCEACCRRAAFAVRSVRDEECYRTLADSPQLAGFTL